MTGPALTYVFEVRVYPADDWSSVHDCSFMLVFTYPGAFAAVGYTVSLAGFAWYNHIKMHQIAAGTDGPVSSKQGGKAGSVAPGAGLSLPKATHGDTARQHYTAVSVVEQQHNLHHQQQALPGSHGMSAVASSRPAVKSAAATALMVSRVEESAGSLQQPLLVGANGSASFGYFHSPVSSAAGGGSHAGSEQDVDMHGDGVQVAEQQGRRGASDSGILSTFAMQLNPLLSTLGLRGNSAAGMWVGPAPPSKDPASSA
jgi:hypothetical protein